LRWNIGFSFFHFHIGAILNTADGHYTASSKTRSGDRRPSLDGRNCQQHEWKESEHDDDDNDDNGRTI
jgi:hypothetical protein